MAFNRRNFLFLLGATTGAASLGIAGSRTFRSLVEPAIAANLSQGTQVKQETDSFALPPLPYDYAALEPHIDAETMRFHHDRHHATYVRELDAALSGYPELKRLGPEGLLRQINNVPEDIQVKVRNNGGGHVNHSMFWEIMSPDGGGEPTGAIAGAINQTFGSFDAFKREFNAAGQRRFGSGWAWLVRTSDGQLSVTNTPNQDSPFMAGAYPIMGNDVWEHAYYLTYQNRRADYLNAWWNVVNWNEVNNRFAQAMA